MLADTPSELHREFGVGLPIIGGRATFLIDAQGKIVKVWPKVSVGGHADDVYASLP